MAHNLNTANGKTSMMYVGEVPWHRLGTKLENPATATEAIQVAGLDFRVVKKTLRTATPDLPVVGHYATVRTDNLQVLGVVGSRYEPIQNRDAFTTFDALVGEGEAIYHTAGVLGKGERIWILAKLPDYIRVNGNDLVEKFLLLTNSHDGSGPVRVKLTPIRVICENTLTVALDGREQEVRIRHTAQAEARLKRAHEILGLTNKLYAELDQIFNGMSKKAMTQMMLDEYLKKIFPDPPDKEHSTRMITVREKVMELTENGIGAEMAKGTLWGAYNAVTELTDHYRRTNADDMAGLKSMWFGNGERIKKRAFEVAVGIMN